MFQNKNVWSKTEADRILNSLKGMKDDEIVSRYKNMKKAQGKESRFYDLVNPEEARGIVEAQALYDCGIREHNGIVTVGSPKTTAISSLKFI